MNILLDTHIAIWALLDSPRLSHKARELIMDSDNTVYYSVISVWEILLKHEMHPDNMDLTAKAFVENCAGAGFIPLDLRDKHVIAAEAFQPSADGHKDPFDRMLLAQAKTENMSLLTNDSKIPLYHEKCVISQ